MVQHHRGDSRTFQAFDVANHPFLRSLYCYSASAELASGILEAECLEHILSVWLSDEQAEVEFGHDLVRENAIVVLLKRAARVVCWLGVAASSARHFPSIAELPQEPCARRRWLRRRDKQLGAKWNVHFEGRSINLEQAIILCNSYARSPGGEAVLRPMPSRFYSELSSDYRDELLLLGCFYEPLALGETFTVTLA